ncbi:uncharacterized protein LOC133180803 [Saccostrea echinata]|uniref:uncharacterized protein LOC133180803 n=1 Tax=Saccostrea echinata TaxID=191078 RepID=UPI002A836FE5|nr:uncharacterized protein LOC133180803 [Saccostrea echinata]
MCVFACFRSVRVRQDSSSNVEVLSVPVSRDQALLTTPNYLYQSTGSSAPVLLDYDRFVSNVEDKIMTDQDSARSRYDAAYLLYKSNPAMFENIPDFTNPRNVYSLISKRRTKSYDDVSTVSRSVDSVTSGFPRISRTTSMRDLRRAAGLRTVSRKGRHHSSQDLSSLTLKERKDPSITALFINAPYLNLKDLDHLPEADVPRATRTVFPAISSKTHALKKVPPFKLSDDDNSFSLPRIPSDLGETLAYGTNGEERADVIKKRIIHHDGNSSVTVENKLNKWFSEMPADVKERADNMATEEETRQSECDSVQKRISRKSPKERVHLPVLKPINTIPNQFLELRENVTRPIRRDVTIDREQYKLKQRSMLQLKMLDMDENIRPERQRTHNETEVQVYSYNAEKFHPQEQKTTLKDLVNAKKQDGDGIKIVSIDEFAVEAYEIHPNDKFNFAKQSNDFHLGTSALSRARTSMDLSTRQRNSLYNTPTFSFYQDEQIEKKAKLSDQPLNRALTVVKIEKPREGTKSDLTGPEHRELASSGSHSSVSIRNGRSARPPTRSTSLEPIKTEAKKELLKFKRLDVFGDGDPPVSAHVAVVDKPLVKLDLRRSPPQWHRSPETFSNPPLPLIHRDIKTELPAMTFQFSTGEVIISRNAANALSPPRDHQRHSFYPSRGPLKHSSSTTPTLPRSESSSVQVERTNQPPARSVSDDASTDCTMTPDFRNISEFNLTGRGRPRGRLWDFDGDIPHPESLLGSRKNTIEEIPEETMDQLSPDPPVSKTPKQMKVPDIHDNPSASSPKQSPNTTPSDQIPSPVEANEQAKEVNTSEEVHNLQSESPCKNLADPSIKNEAQPTSSPPATLKEDTKEEKGGEKKEVQELEKEERRVEDGVKEEKQEKTETHEVRDKNSKRDVATSATSLIEANAKRQTASSKNTDRSTDSITEVFGK